MRGDGTAVAQDEGGALAGRYQQTGYAEITPDHRLYSEASIGKAELRRLGVPRWRQSQPDTPGDITATIMETYYGGVTEAHIRLTPTRPPAGRRTGPSKRGARSGRQLLRLVVAYRLRGSGACEGEPGVVRERAVLGQRGGAGVDEVE